MLRTTIFFDSKVESDSVNVTHLHLNISDPSIVLSNDYPQGGLSLENLQVIFVLAL